MTISDELFMSILAMDSYNRGYNFGIGGANGLSELSDGTVGIGNATVSFNIEDAGLEDLAEPQSFYAIAYEYDGQTIISYRGNDVQPGLFPPRLGDATTGWPIGAGIIEGTQVDLARVFYEQVTQTGLFDGGDAQHVSDGCKHPSYCPANGPSAFSPFRMSIA